MQSLILAAGRGSRINELTQNVPKCLIDFNRKPLLRWQLNSLKKYSDSTIIVGGYSINKIKKYVHGLPGIEIIMNKKWESTNMLYSLMCAREKLKKKDTIISYSDIFYSTKAVEKLYNSKDEIAILYDPNWQKLWTQRFKNPLDDAESFKVDDNFYLLEIGNKLKNMSNCIGQFMGLLKITKEGWSLVEKITKNYNVKFDNIDTTSFINYLLKKNIKIKAIPSYESWGEVDTYNDLKLYENMLANKYFKWML